jgi:hypothetical protein
MLFRCAAKGTNIGGVMEWLALLSDNLGEFQWLRQFSLPLVIN